jgi:tellurite resistance protein
MQTRIETAAEACAALAVLIAAADDLGTSEERGYLFETVKAMPIFADLDPKQFKKLMAETTAGLYASSTGGATRMSSADVGRLVDMIRDALPPERRVEALEVAVGLARSDGVVSVEALLLQRLCEGLEIDADATHRLLGRLA